MASHVPFLAVRPDQQFSDEVKSRDFASINGAPPYSSSVLVSSSDPVDDDDVMDAPEAPARLPRMPPASRLPSAVRLPILLLLSFSISGTLLSVTQDVSGYQLGAISREPVGDYAPFYPLALRATYLLGAWYAGYDWKDTTALSILANLPYYFFLTTFYNVGILAASTHLTVDTAAISIPFLLLRPLIHAHEPGRDPNQLVAQDTYIFSYMAFFGASIYGLVVYSSLYTWLPVYLVTHFNYIRSLEGAHEASVLVLALYFIPMGWATAQFLFTPAVGSRGNPGITDPTIYPQKVRFDPETAGFGETIAFNLGWGEDGFTKRAEVLAKRTGVLVVASVFNTFARTWMTLEGSEPVGALGWASVWGVAAVLTSLAYGWAGNE